MPTCPSTAWPAARSLGVPRALGAPRAATACAARGTEPDYADVIGQEVAKRGLAIAAAGGLGLLMVGSPGAGKSMLAERMTSILPTIDERERQEALCIHSVRGEPVEGLLAGRRPIRSPHHSISAAGLAGVLYLDELAEFPSSVLQTLRQPMESGRIRIVRAEGAYTFPARFQLLAASNPCPCGHLGDREVACTCPPAAVERYRAKLSGPLADRIDLCIDVARPELIVRGAQGACSADLRAQVERGRAFTAWRTHRSRPAAEGSAEGIEGAVAAFGLDEGAGQTLVRIARTGKLTARGIVRVCRIARTVADMAESERVRREHVLEASMFRGRTADER